MTVTADTTAELGNGAIVGDADLVELLDTVSDPSAAGAPAGRRKPVIVTCRHQSEGGHFGAAKKSGKILSEAIALGAEYVDPNEGQLRRSDARHRRPPHCPVESQLRRRARRPSEMAAMRATGAEVVKIATGAPAH